MVDKRLVLLIALVALANAVPVEYERTQSQQCAVECKSDGQQTLFDYEPGKTYVYKYEADTITTLDGTTQEYSSVHIRAQAEIEVLSRCELSLRLRDVSIEESDPERSGSRRVSDGFEEFKNTLERDTLRFAYQDGRIEDLCPSREEPTWSLNIKRGLLSAFQNSMGLDESSRNLVEETDVAGKCNVEYTADSNLLGKTTITKTKDLRSCTDRQNTDFALSLFSDSYNSDSQVQSSPIVNSTQTCQQTVDGIVKTSLCSERHAFRPFSNGGRGAVTTTRQYLEYVNKYNNIRARFDNVVKRTDLLYKHEKNSEEKLSHAQETEEILQQICANEDIRPETPHLFKRLVSSLKRLDAATLQNTYRRIDSICSRNNNVRKFYLDALPMVGTSAAYKLMTDILLRYEVAGLQADAWATSFAFVHHPNKEMIAAITPLLERTNPARSVVLGASALIHSYCHHNTECMNEDEVKNAVRKFDDILGYKCKAEDKEQEDRIITALKALGNAGRTTAQVTLARCFQESTNSIPMRLAAIDAFRRMPCQYERRDMLRAFLNVEEDTEIRIGAYLAAMKCPTREVVQKVKDTLNKEVVNQVGSFVWTHLTNIKESSDPCKREISELLEDHTLKAKFDKDSRKFSRHFEGSLFSDALNLGAHAESNLIFSPKSYIPRSSMLNLTLDLFGSAVNVFEVGGRIEGFEFLVESLFGPNGYFQDPEEEQTADAKNNVDASNTEVRAPLINKINDNFVKPSDEAQGSFYVKTLGNELGFYDFKGFDDFKRSTHSSTFFDLLIKLSKNQEVEYTMSQQPLDASYVIPTAIGLPLNLTVTGTYSVSLKAGGKADLRQIIKSPRSMDIAGYIKPSAAVELSTMMSVDAFVSRSGVKMVSTMHTSTALEGTIQLKDGQVLNVDFKTPREKQEIIDVETKLFVVHREVEHEQRGVEDNRREMTSCTGERLTKWTGLQLCGAVTYPNASHVDEAPYYPLTGPTRVTLYLAKSDPTMKGYHLEMKLKNSKRERSHVAKVSFNTPGSRVDREWTAEFDLNRNDKSLNINLKSPFKKFTVEGKVTDGETLKSANFLLNYDESIKYSVKSELRVDETASSKRYSPSLEVSMPRRQPITFKGYWMLYKQENRVYVDLAVNELFSKPVSVKGDLSRQGKSDADKFTGDISVKSEYVDSRISGYAQLKEHSYTGKVDMEYTLPSHQTEKITLTGKVRPYITSSLYKFSTTSEILFTAYPDYNTQFDWELQQTTGYLENSISFQYGRQFSDYNKLTIGQVYKNSNDGKLAMSFDVKYPVRRVDGHFELNHEFSGEKLNSRVAAKYNGRQCGGDVQVANDKTQPLSFYGDMNVDCVERSAKLHAELKKSAQNEVTGQTYIRYGQQEFRVDGSYQNKNYGDQLNTKTEVTLRTPYYQPIKVSGSVLGHMRQAVVNGQVQYEGHAYTFDGQYQKQSANGHSLKVTLQHPKHRVDAEANVINGNNIKSGNLDVKIHDGRHITATFRTKNEDSVKSSSFDVFWDADQDREKMIHWDGELKNDFAARYGSNRMEGRFAAKYPIKSIDVSGAFSSDYQGHIRNGRIVSHAVLDLGQYRKFELKSSVQNRLDSIQDFKASVQLSTPYRGYEETTFNLTHNYDGQNVKSHLYYGFKYGKPFVADLSGIYTNRQLDGTLHIASPLPGYDDVTFNIKHNKISGGVNSHVDVIYNRNRQVSMDLEGNMQKSKLKIRTPFEGYENFAMEHEVTPHSNGHYTVSSSYQWSPVKQIKVLATMRDNKSSNREITSTISLQTPFESYKDVSLAFQLKNKPDRYFETSVNLEKEGQKVSSVRLVGGREYTREKMCYGSVHITTPFYGYDDMKFDVKHILGDHEIIESVQYRWATDKSVALDVRGMLKPSNGGYHFTSNVSLETPYYPWRNLKVGINHRYESNALEGTVEVDWDRYKKMVLSLNGDHSFTRAGRNINAQALLTTPFKNFELFKLIGTHSSKDGLYDSPVEADSQVEATWRHGQRAQLSHKFNFGKQGGVTKFDSNLRFVSTLDNLDDLSLVMSHTNTERSIKSEVTARWAHDKRVAAYLEAKDMSTTGRRDYFTALTLKTPYQYYESIRSEFTHKDDGRTFNCHFTSFYGRENSKIDITSDVTINGLSEFDGKIKFMSPIRDYEYLTLTTNMKNTVSSKILQAIFERNSREKIDFFTRFEKPNPMSYNVFTKFNSNIVSFERDIEASSTTSVQATKSESKNYFRSGNKKIELDGLVRGNLQQKVDFDVQFRSPFPDFERLQLTGSHEYQRDQCVTDLTFQWRPTSKVTINHVNVYRFASAHPVYLEGKTTITTPFRGYESVTMRATYDNAQGDHKVNTNFHLGRSTFVSFSGSFMYHPYSKLHTTAQLSSSFSGFEKKSAELTYVRGAHHSIKAVVMYAIDQQMSLDANIRYYPDMDVFVNYKSPFYSFEDITFKATYNKQQEHLATASLAYAPNKIVSIVGKLNIPHFASVTFSSPFIGYEVLEFKAEHTQNRNDHTAVVTVKYAPNNMVTVNANYRLRPDVDLVINFKSPFYRYEDITFAASYNKQRQHNAIVSLKYAPNKSVSLEGAVNFPHSASVTFKSPFRDYEFLQAKGQHIRNYGNEHIASASFKYGNKVIKIDGNVKGVLPNVAGNIRLSTPFDGYRDVSAFGTYSKHGSQHRTSAKIQYDNRLISLDASGVFERDNIDCQAKFTSPFRNFESITFNTQYKLASGEYHTLTSLQYASNNRISVEGRFSPKPDSVETFAQIKTPFRNFESITFNTQYKLASGEYHTLTSLQYASNNRISVEGRFSPKPDSVETFAQIKTPFRNARDISLRTSFKREGAEHKASALFNYGPSKTISLEGSHKSQNQNREATIIFRSPFRYYEQITLNGNYEKQANKHVFNGRYEFGYNKVVTVTAEGEIHQRLIDVSLKFKSPFQYYEQISFGFMAKMPTARQFTINTQYQYLWDGRNQVISLDLSAGSNPELLEGYVKFKSPFRNYEEISFSTKTQATHSVDHFTQYTSLTSLHYGYNKVISLEGRVGYNYTVRSVMVHFKSPFQHFEDLMYSHDFGMEKNNVYSTSVFKYGDKVVRLTGQHKDDGQKINSFVNFKSPYKSVEDLSFVNNYDRKDRVHNSKTSFKWAPYKSIDIDMNHANGDKYCDTNLQVTSPFNGYEKLSMKTGYNGKRNEHNGYFTFNWTPTKQVSVRGKFAHSETFADTNLHLNVKTPFRSFEDMTYNFDMKKTTKDLTNLHVMKTEFTWAPRKSVYYEVSYQDNVHSQDVNVTFRSSVDSYYAYIRDFTFSGHHDYSEKTHNVRLVSSVNRQRPIVVDARVKTDSYAPSVILNFRSSFEGLEELSFSGSVDRRTQKAIVSVQWPYEKVMELSGEYRMSGNNHVFAKLHFISPFKHFENMKVEGQYDYQSQQYTTRGLLQWSNLKKIEAIGQLKIDATNMESNVIVTTPFYNYKKMAFHAKHKRGDVAHNVQATLDLGENSHYEFTGDAKKNGRIWEISTKTRTPFSGFEENEFGYHCDRDGDTTTCTLSFNYWTGKTVTIVAKITNSGDPSSYLRKAEITITSPIPGLENVDSIIMYSKKPGYYKSQVSCKWADNQQFSIDTEMKKAPNHYEMTINMKSPMYNDVNAYVYWDKTDSTYKSIQSCQWAPNKKYQIVHEGKFSPGHYENKNTFTSPFKGYEKIVSTAMYDKKGNNYKSQMTCTWAAGKTFAITTTVDKTGGKYHWNVDIKTPWTGFEYNAAAIEYANQARGIISGKITSEFQGKKYMFSGDINAANYHLDLKFDAPYRHFRDLELVLDYANSKLNVAVQYAPNKKIAFDIVFGTKGDTYFVDFSGKTPFSGYEEMQGKLNSYMSSSQCKHDFVFIWGRNQRITMNLNLEHAGRFPNYKGELTITTPFYQYEHGSIKFDNRYDGELKNTLEVEWSRDRKIKSDLLMSVNPETKEIHCNYQLTTPFDEVRSALFNFVKEHSSENRQKSDSYTVKFDLNEQQLVDVNVIKNKFLDRSSSIKYRTMVINDNINKYYAKYENQYKLDGTRCVMKVDSFLPYLDKFGGEFTHSVIRGDQSWRHDLNMKTTTPTRKMEVDTHFEMSPSKVSHKFVFCWDADKDRKMSWEGFVTKSYSGDKLITDALMHFSHPIRGMKLTAHQEWSPRQLIGSLSYNWDDRYPGKTTVVNVKLDNLSRLPMVKFATELELKHPSLRKSIMLRNQFSLYEERDLLFSKTELDYSQDWRNKYTWLVRVADDAQSSDRHNYTVTLATNHPATNMDIKLFSHLADTRDVSSGAMQLLYLARDGKVNNYAIRSRLNKLRNNIAMEVESPTTNLDMNGQYRFDEDGLQVSMVTRKDGGRSVYRSEVNLLNKPQRKLQVKVYYDPTNPHNVFYLNAGLVNRTLFNVEAYHTRNNRRINDAQIALQLKSSRLLNTKLYWRPTVYFDLKDGVTTVDQAVNMLLNSQAFNRFERELKREILYHARQTMSHFEDEFEPVGEYNRQEFALFLEDLTRYMQELKGMYLRNEFYSRTILDYFEYVIKKTDRAFWRYRNHVAYKMELLGKAYTQATEGASMTYQAYSNEYGRMVGDAKEKMTKAMNNYARDVAYRARDVLDRAQYVADQAKSVTTDYMDKAQNTARDYHRVAMETAGDTRARLADYSAQKMTDVAEYAKQRYEEHLPKINKAAEMAGQLKDKVHYHMQRAKRVYDNVNDYLVSHPYYEQVQNTLDTLKHHVESMTDQLTDQYGEASERVADVAQRVRHHYTHLDKHINAAKQYLNSLKDKAVDAHKENMAAIGQRLSALQDHLMSYEDVRSAKELGDQAVSHARWAYNYMDVEQKAQDIVDYLKTYAKETAHKEIIEPSVRYLYNMAQEIRDSARAKVYDLKEGRIELEQALPWEWRDLDTLPSLEDVPIYRAVKRAVEQYAPEDAANLWDVYYTYKPASFNPRDWIPPFSARAMLIGNQDYVTFDRKFYRFAGQCSYLLAHDFKDGNFSVIVNYERQPNGAVEKKSLTVYISGKSIELFTDFSIAVDGQQKELPYQIGNTTIYRHQNSVLLSNRHGVRLDCNWVQDVVTLDLSGWYFGRTAGLFGSYDNEESNDFTMADQRRTDNVEEFAYSFNVDESCRSRRNYAPHRDVRENTEEYQTCYRLFKDKSSEMRPCHKQVDAEDYLQMCLQYSSQDPAAAFAHTCRIASAYVTECQRVGVDVSTPNTCTQCRNPNGGTMLCGQNVQIHEYSKYHSSADVVFIVEEKPCNREYGRRIYQVASEIENAFKQVGLKSTRYGVVGYGGPNVHKYPHMHTSNGHVWTDISGLGSAVSNLVYDSHNLYQDVFDAISFAAGYHFRAGASKTIVLVTCTGCARQDINDYSEMHSLLIENDITLHVLNDARLSLRHSKKSKNLSPVFGIDSNEAFTRKHARGSSDSIDGDDALYHHVKQPKDVCLALAQETNGSMFDSAHMKDKRMEKRFYDVFSRRVAQSATPRACQVCMCMPEMDGFGFTQCKPCTMPDAATIVQSSDQVHREIATRSLKSKARSNKNRQRKLKGRSLRVRKRT